MSSNIIARSVKGYVYVNLLGAPSKGYRFACVPFVGATSWYDTEQGAINALIALNPSSLVTYAPATRKA